MFDEQPDGDPHGECAAEIHRLQAQLGLIDAALSGWMVNATGPVPVLVQRVQHAAIAARRYRLLRAACTDAALQEAIEAATAQASYVGGAERLDAALDAVLRERGL